MSSSILRYITAAFYGLVLGYVSMRALMLILTLMEYIRWD